MLLTPSEILRPQPADYWFCLKARPKREHLAAACLRQNLEAVVTRLISAGDRVEILIEWMGRSLHAEADMADLLPLTGPRS
jgi:hypothetical protein